MPPTTQRATAQPHQHRDHRPRTLTVIEGGKSATPHVVPLEPVGGRQAPASIGLCDRADPAGRARIVTQLQRTHGNAHVQRFLSSAPRRTSSAAVKIQRCGDHACNCSQEQRDVFAASQQVERAVEQLSSIDVGAEIQRSSGGTGLHPDARAKLEPAMGMDLGHVTIHSNAEADVLSRSFDAEAFTSGNHIFFREGRYDPHSPGGLRLLAHEIAHTVQQANGPVSGIQHSSGVQVNEPDDEFEREAEHIADETMARLGAAKPDVSGGDGKSGSVSRASLSIQRRAPGSQRALIQRAPTVDSGGGFQVTWTPFARVAGPPFDQTTNFDKNPFHDEFSVPPKATGFVILLADVAWKKTAVGPTPPGPLPPGPLPPGPLPPIPFPPEVIKACDACTKLPPIAPQPDLDSCFRLPDLCSRRIVAEALLTKYTKDPCELINTKGNIGLIIAKAACKASVIAFKATGLGLVIFEGIDTLRAGLQDLNSALCAPVATPPNCAPITPTPGPGPNPQPQPQPQEGKGRATLETRFFVGVDGKIQVVGLPPRVQASGAAAELVSPVDFIRTDIPGGVNIAFQPMLKGTTAGETNVFQHQWDIDIKQPAPPAPQPFRFGLHLFPFKTGKEFFEDEGTEQAKLLNWFSTMDPRIFNRIATGQIPVGVAGRASKLGDPAFNLSLSEKRAKRVAQMVNDFGGSLASAVTFAFGELLAGGGPKDNSPFFRRADVGVCGQLEGADAAAGPIQTPNLNTDVVCDVIGPKKPPVQAGALPEVGAGNLPSEE
jgi:hypothetical protein